MKRAICNIARVLSLGITYGLIHTWYGLDYRGYIAIGVACLVWAVSASTEDSK